MALLLASTRRSPSSSNSPPQGSCLRKRIQTWSEQLGEERCVTSRCRWPSSGNTCLSGPTATAPAGAGGAPARPAGSPLSSSPFSAGMPSLVRQIVAQPTTGATAPALHEKWQPAWWAACCSCSSRQGGGAGAAREMRWINCWPTGPWPDAWDPHPDHPPGAWDLAQELAQAQPGAGEAVRPACCSRSLCSRDHAALGLGAASREWRSEDRTLPPGACERAGGGCKVTMCPTIWWGAPGQRSDAPPAERRGGDAGAAELELGSSHRCYLGAAPAELPVAGTLPRQRLMLRSPSRGGRRCSRGPFIVCVDRQVPGGYPEGVPGTVSPCSRGDGGRGCYLMLSPPRWRPWRSPPTPGLRRRSAFPLKFSRRD